MAGRDLSQVFSSLRPNEPDLELRGGQLPQGQQAAGPLTCFTGIPTAPICLGPFAGYYLRNTYLENNLRVPGKLNMLGRTGRSRPDQCARLFRGNARRPYRAVAYVFPGAEADWR